MTVHRQAQVRARSEEKAGDVEGIFPAFLDLERLRDYRRRETWGDAFRRPGVYARLTGQAVTDPFVRVDHLGQAPAR